MLSSLFKKERISDLFMICSFALKKRAICCKKIRSFHNFFDSFFTVIPLFMLKSKSLPSLFAPFFVWKERQEQFSLFALYKRATVSDKLPPLLKKEQNSESLVFCEQIAITSDSLEKPKSEFPTLSVYIVWGNSGNTWETSSESTLFEEILSGTFFLIF